MTIYTVNISINVQYELDEEPKESKILDLIKDLYYDADGEIDVYSDKRVRYYLRDGILTRSE